MEGIEHTHQEDNPHNPLVEVVAPVRVLSAAELALTEAMRQQAEQQAAQMAALQQMVQQQALLMQQQAQQLQELRASPAQSPQGSPHAAPQPPPSRPLTAAALAPAAAARPLVAASQGEEQSRFARKEPRAQDLREYDGAPGAKLDAWLQELTLATDLYELNEREAVKFAASRLRDAALQWWLALGAEGRAAMRTADALAMGLRERFQPITASRVAREQLDLLQQGGRSVNDYIADFQRISTQIGLASLGEENALHAFERGLRRDLAVELRKQGVQTLKEAIAMAARVGGLMQQQAARPAPTASAHQMEVDQGNGTALEERVARSVLNALQAQGVGAKTQTQRSYQQERRGAGRSAGRGGNASSRLGEQRSLPPVPGVPAAVVEQRRAAGQCYRCGSADHTRFECPNATSASHSSN